MHEPALPVRVFPVHAKGMLMSEMLCNLCTVSQPELPVLFSNGSAV